MNDRSIAIVSTGLVTSVGLSAPASCAAIRAKISNPTETRFIDSNGEWIMAHQVQLDKPWRGRAKLAKMAAMAIEECLEGVERREWSRIPLLLCVAEKERPGRMEGLDDRLLGEVEEALEVRFGAGSAVIAWGRVSVLVALVAGQKIVSDNRSPSVLIVATDSLLNWSTLSAYVEDDRLLTSQQSNGFLPGEASGALLIGQSNESASIVCEAVDFGMEPANVHAELPLRAQGLTTAIKRALAKSGRGMQDISFGMADASGESYYFKEAALALTRTLRQRRESFDIWHPAECVGETGAAIGAVVIAVAFAATEKSYAPGDVVLAHLSNDAGQRAATVLYRQGRRQ
jgi:3-oxoacyl-[acyl-carrier-protein] synthase-1